MSKITKLINSPDKFFKDFVKKRVTYLENNFLNSKPTAVTINKQTKLAVAKKAEVKAKPNEQKSKPSAAKKPNIVQQITFNVTSLIHEYQVTTIFHCGEEAAVGMTICRDWIKYTYDFRKNTVILVRNSDLYNNLRKEYSHINIVYAKSPTDIEKVLLRLPNLKKICFVSNTSNNIHLIRFNQYQHIFCGNFDLHRQPGVHKFFRAYDEIWTNNEYTKDCFLNELSTRHLKVLNIGNPRSNSFISKSNIVRTIYIKINPNLQIVDSLLSIFLNLHKKLSNQCIFYVENIKSRQMTDLKKYCEVNNIDVNFGNFSNNINIFDVVFSDFEDDFSFQKIAAINIPIFYFKPNNLDALFNISNSKFNENIFLLSSVDEFYHAIHQLESNEEFLIEYKEFLKYRFGFYEKSKEVFAENLKSLLIK